MQNSLKQADNNQDSFSFSGLRHASVDDTGRVPIPSMFWPGFQYADEHWVVATINPFHECLILYTKERWKNIESEISKQPYSNDKIRQMQRLVIGLAQEVKLDAQGRLLLPTGLRSVKLRIPNTLDEGELLEKEQKSEKQASSPDTPDEGVLLEKKRKSEKQVSSPNTPDERVLLGRRVVFVGVGKRVEIWSADSWQVIENKSSDPDEVGKANIPF